MPDRHTIINQLKRNAVALTSLMVAITALTYNTWRNEVTEDNRNQRQAAFEILLKLNELQQVVFHLRYDKDEADKGNPRTGWAYALTVKDLSRVMEPPMPAKADELVEVWGNNWEGLMDDEASELAILNSIDETGNTALNSLQ